VIDSGDAVDGIFTSIPFKCLVFNLYFVFLCTNNRKRYGTRQYELTNSIYIEKKTIRFVSITFTIISF
jgi:hypothetical protein